MKYYCNPVNLEYQYQLFKIDPEKDDLCEIHREAADPSLVLFKGKYYLFPSMSGGFYASETLLKWQYHTFLNEMPIYDYAPDVRVIGDYLYFSASKADEPCSFYRTGDPLKEPFEKVADSFAFWDPNLFYDDGRLFFYWGCSNLEPVYGIELNPQSWEPIGEKVPLIYAGEKEHGYERAGEDHVPPKTEQEVEMTVQRMLAGASEEMKSDEQFVRQLYGWFGTNPYVEGAWMTKYRGKYYLQYATPGTEYNVYADGVYVSDSPLGPFCPAKNNPYSYHPGGFITGAGHGSTLEDKEGRIWHTSTMRISRNHNFERRVGLWKAGFDAEGELFCNQRYGDWPIRLDAESWEQPDWMLLSYKKPVKVSSGTGAEYITDEDIRTWWKADLANQDEWIEVDLGETMDVRAVQINFADDFNMTPDAGLDFYFDKQKYRAIDSSKKTTRWLLEGSLDGREYFVLEDNTKANSDFSHDFLVWEEGKRIQYIRLSAIQLPYQQPPCVSGIRVFGKGSGALPEQVKNVKAELIGENPMDSIDMKVSWEQSDAIGHNVLWGYEPEKLYHSYLVYEKTEQKIGALVKGQPIYIRVDAFNENGITEGVVQKIRDGKEE